jgi:hypothetical protein
MAMEKIDRKELERLRQKYKFKFCRVKGTGVINITKNPDNPRFEIIGIEDFVKELNNRKLAVYKSSNDFLKIMKK